MKERIGYIDCNLTRLIQKKCETLRKRQTKADKQRSIKKSRINVKGRSKK